MPAPTANFITEGVLGRAILRLAAPEVASQLLRWAFVTADTYFVGRLGGPELAALSAASFAYWGLQALGLLLSIGVSSLVARHTGAKDPHAAQQSATQGALWALPYGVMIGALTVTLSHQFVHLAPSPEAAAGAQAFLQIIALGLPLLYLGYVGDAAFRASGDPKTPLLLLGCASLVNLALDPILIFSLGMGIRGAALATIGSQAVAAVVGAVLLWRRGLLGGALRPSVRHFAQICRIGAPIALSSLLFSLIYLVLTGILAPYGDAAVAGLAVGHRIEALPYLVAVGLGSAATTLVGQNLGAKRPDRARQAAWRCAGYASAVALLCAAVMFLLPGPLARLLAADDPAVIEAGALYVKLIALSQLGMALEIVIEGAFSGAGDTIPPMALSILFTAARIPLGMYLAASGLGYEGVYWALTVTGLLRGLSIAAFFYRRAEKHAPVGR